ncbi:hypothetical protein [Variovorax sp. V15]|uniref:hypothetical protein n=1 Tax=Variovorax sp. V15 TaxID=3065952 RepID=UPI0034E8C415
MNYWRNSIFLTLAIWGIAALCAIYLPLDIARQVESINPIPFLWKSISGWKGFARSEFPEISSTYYSIAWLSYPLFFHIVWHWLRISMDKGMDGLLVKRNLTFGEKIFILLSIPIFLLLIYGITVGNEGQSLRYFQLGKSRLDLAIFGIIAPAAAAICSAIIAFGLFRVFNFWRKA